MKLTDLLSHVGRPVAYYPGLRFITKSTTGTIFLCQLIYWTGKQADPDGWIYKTTDELTTETGLSYEEQVTARKKLVANKLIEEKYDRLNHVMKYRIVPDAINAAWDDPLGDFENSRNREQRFREKANPEMGKEVSTGSLKESESTLHRLLSEIETAAAFASDPVPGLSYDPGDIDGIDAVETFEKSEKPPFDVNAYKTRIAAAIERGQAKHAADKFDVSGYPEPIRDVLKIVVERWRIDPPGGRKPSPDWIKSGRELLESTGEFGVDLISAYADRFEKTFAETGEYPFAVSRPGSLINAIRAFAAEVRTTGSIEPGRKKERGYRAPLEFGPSV